MTWNTEKTLWCLGCCPSQRQDKAWKTSQDPFPSKTSMHEPDLGTSRLKVNTCSSEAPGLRRLCPTSTLSSTKLVSSQNKNVVLFKNEILFLEISKVYRTPVTLPFLSCQIKPEAQHIKINCFLHLVLMRHHDLSYSCAQIPNTPEAYLLSHGRGQSAGLGHKSLALAQQLCDAEQALPCLSFGFSI